jgi:hypothetical protein
MVKKSLIAIALVGMLASTSFAGDMAKGYWKFDDNWPFTVKVTWDELELCQIPIYIDIGMYIELVDCNKIDGKTKKPIKKIVLEQIDCGDLKQGGSGKGKTGTDFPCYSGCEDLTVRSNFDALLGLKLRKKVWKNAGGDDVSFITQRKSGFNWYDNWTAYFDDAGTPKDTWPVTGNGMDEDFTVCVEASDVDIFLGDPDADPISEVNRVGELAITVVPTATPDLCSLLCKSSKGQCVPK